MKHNYYMYYNFTVQLTNKLTCSHPQGVHAPQVNNQSFRLSKRKSG